MIQNYGVIENFFNDDQLEKWKDNYQKISSGEKYKDSHTWGLFDSLGKQSTKNNFGYKYFVKEIVPTIADLLHKNTVYNYSAFIHMWGPLKIHKDLPPNDDLIPGRSLCFPYSVNGSRYNYQECSTRIFDQDKNLIDTLLWKPNMLLWWEGNLYHDSGNFDNLDYKEFFITQTYLEKSF
jgi:hypothetical protein